jgi:hypothetical protein
MNDITLIGTCHSCERNPCPKPKIKAKRPMDGCAKWTDGKPAITPEKLNHAQTK